MFNKKSGKQVLKQIRAERKDRRLAERVLRPPRMKQITPGMLKRAAQHEAYELNKAK